MQPSSLASRLPAFPGVHAIPLSCAQTKQGEKKSVNVYDYNNVRKFA